jgi:lysyl-tRNA synthetase class 2
LTKIRSVLGVRANTIRAIAALTALVAMAVLVSAAAPAWAVRPVAGLAGLVTDGSPGLSAAVALGGTLLVLARGLGGGRRLARHLLLATLLVGLGASILAKDPTESVSHRPVRWVLGVAVCGALLALRHDFPTIVDPRRVRGAVYVAAAGLTVVIVHAGWLVLVARDDPAVPLGPALPLEGSGGLVAAGALVLALAVALGPAPAPPPDTPTQRARVASLVTHPDADSLAPFITRADKTYVFSPDGTAAIGFRVLSGVALAGGDPVGAPAAADAAITAFLDTCAHNGWRPAVVGAGSPLLERWRAKGVRRHVVIGDEAVIDVASFTLASRQMRNVRQAVRRTHNAGVTVHIGQLDAARAAELEPVLRDWLDGRHERGFSMNLDRLLVPRPDCVVAVAYDRDGLAQGFARFAVCGAGRVLTLDVAPRRADAPNGIVERLIIDVVEYGRAFGVCEVSLNFAGFRGMYESSGPAARTVAALTHVLDRWIALGPLYRFTAKFHPNWHARSVLLRSWLDIVWVGIAALRAELGQTRGRGSQTGEPAYEPAIAWSTSPGILMPFLNAATPVEHPPSS